MDEEWVHRGHKFTLSPNHHRRLDRLSILWGKPLSATVRAVLAVGLQTCESRQPITPDILDLIRSEGEDTWAQPQGGGGRGP